MDPTLVRVLWKDLDLNMKLAELILNGGLLKTKVPGMRNFKDLYKIFARHQQAIWDAGNEQAAETISLPGDEGGYRRPPQPRPQANVLHLVASFNGADKIKKLADIGSMLALWAIEETCFWVKEDKDENENDPENAEFADLWGTSEALSSYAGLSPEEMHAQGGYNESLLKILNARLQE